MFDVPIARDDARDGFLIDARSDRRRDGSGERLLERRQDMIRAGRVQVGLRIVAGGDRHRRRARSPGGADVLRRVADDQHPAGVDLQAENALGAVDGDPVSSPRSAESEP